MIDHMTLHVTDLPRARAFYDKVLPAIGYGRISPDEAAAAGYGDNRSGSFWIAPAAAPIRSVHVAFAAADRAGVDAFYAAALAAGGRDNGKPGLRPQYHPDYYGAFVIDPDGHNVEAVCHRPA